MFYWEVICEKIVLCFNIGFISFWLCSYNISDRRKMGTTDKVEKFEDKTIYYYYYRHYYLKTKPGGLTVRGDSVPGATADYTVDWVIYEFTADETGKIIKERRYTKQPKLD